jgi:hypothetical protein
MNKMRLPGFTAEKSVNKNNSYYYRMNHYTADSFRGQEKILPQRLMLLCASIDECNRACGIHDEARGACIPIGIFNICVV